MTSVEESNQDLQINEDSRSSPTKVISIKDIIIGDRFRKDLGDLEGLAESIKEVGLLQNPVLNEANELICGARRIEAVVQYLHWKEIPVTIVSLSDILSGEFHENANRKNFTSTETIEIKHELEKRFSAEAKKRQGQRNDLNIPSTSTESEDWDESEPNDTRDKVANYFGIGWNTLDKLENVVSAAKENPIEFGELPTKIDEGMKVNTAWKKIQPEVKQTETNEEQVLLKKIDRVSGKNIELLKEYPDRKAVIGRVLIDEIEKEMSV
jgi:hypothetical protein